MATATKRRSSTDEVDGKATKRHKPASEFEPFLTALAQPQHPLTKVVPNPTSLTQALKELEGLIEMGSAKSDVLVQLNTILFQAVSGKKPTTTPMHHCCIYGPPGVGKTKLAQCLAKIWMSLGLLRAPQSHALACPCCQPKITAAENKTDIYQRSLGKAHQIAERQREVLTDIRGSLQDLRRDRLDRISSTKRDHDYVLHQIEDIKHQLRTARFDNDDLLYLTHDPILPAAQPADPVKIVGRQDFVAGYVGQSALKTEKLIKENLGKVIFIDEAYALALDEKDSFGHEVLTVINRYMSERPHDVIFIFAGYKELLQKTIFRAQPGLERRCKWVINIEGYTAEGLQKIFVQQLKSAGWALAPEVDLKAFFESHNKAFPAYGGDTERLADHCGNVHAAWKMRELLAGQKVVYDNLITEPMLKAALEELKRNVVTSQEENPAQLSYYL